jgi:hypothetical protein
MTDEEERKWKMLLRARISLLEGNPTLQAQVNKSFERSIKPGAKWCPGCPCAPLKGTKRRLLETCAERGGPPTPQGKESPQPNPIKSNV